MGDDEYAVVYEPRLNLQGLEPDSQSPPARNPAGPPVGTGPCNANDMEQAGKLS